jgi:catechol 2,3-dioxygenase-like lactoylglutathione lyase family enzyme
MVDDLDAACARVEACGGRVLGERRVAGAVFVEDPDGRPIELLAPGSPLVAALHPGG